jgi:hypothetical protein
MSPTTIPADAVLRLRDALCSQLGYVAQELSSAVRERGRERHPEWFAEPVARFDRTRALLDEIGWREHGPEQDAEIDLDQHRQVIVAALSDQLATEHHFMAEQGDAAKTQRERAHHYARTIETFAENVGLELK